MDTSSFQPPVSQMFHIGEPATRTWPDYPTQYNLTLDNAADLIRLVQADRWDQFDWDESEAWAPIHAWRALGQLRATSAIKPLVSLLPQIDEYGYDWMQEEMPTVFALLGPDAIPALQQYLSSAEYGEWSRVTVALALVEIVAAYPSERERAVAILTEQLAHHTQQSPIVNAELVHSLTELNAVESDAVMEAAFAADSVDLSVMGDWEEVQIELGLLDERITPPPENGWLPLTPEIVELRQLLSAVAKAPPTAASLAPESSTTGSTQSSLQKQRDKRRRNKKLAKQTKQKQRKKRRKK